MPSWEHLLPFFAATFAFAVFPGPALLYTAAQTLTRGRGEGFLAALGIHAGCYVHVFAAAFGLSAVFHAVPTLYYAIKLLGAAYLVWLGFKMLLARGDTERLPAVTVKSRRRAFFDGFLVELLNPKVAIFFIAFLPQFVSADASLAIWAQMAILGVIVNFAFSSADVVTVFFTDAIVRRVRSSGATKNLFRWASGSTLIGLGAHLAVSRQ